MMKMIYNFYDDQKRVIARVRVNEKNEISESTFKRILNKRIIKGDAGIYSESRDVKIVKDGHIITVF